MHGALLPALVTELPPAPPAHRALRLLLSGPAPLVLLVRAGFLGAVEGVAVGVVDRGFLVDLSANPDGTLHHPGQVDQVCRREDLADLVAADTPLGPEQATARLGVRRADFNHMVRLVWARSPQSVEARFGISRAGAVNIALYTTASIDTVPAEHPKVDWEQLRTVEKGRRSPLAALCPQPAPAAA